MPPRAFDYSGRKKPRNCDAKVKSGCRTCKLRHIKCDELKPECQKCKGTGRKCDYIGTVKAVHYLNTRSVSVSLPGNDQEQRQFAFFAAHTARDLSGHFDEGFWDGLVLQVSFQVPAMRHAIVALASLHESYKDGTYQRGCHQHDGSLRTFAVMQYTKALGSLGIDLASGKANSMVTLMTCVVFICFESLRDQFDSFLVHLRSGMQLTRNLLRSNTLSPSDAYFLRKSLTSLLKRLWLQAIIYLDATSPEAIGEIWTDWVQDTMVSATSFTTFEEARNSLNDHIDTVACFYHESRRAQSGNSQPKEHNGVANGHDPLTSSFPEYMSLKSECPKIRKPLPQAALSQWTNLGINLVDALAIWEERFNKLLKSKTSILYSSDIRAATLLKIHHIVIEIIVKSSPGHHASTEENPFTGFTSHFKQLLELCRSLILPEQSLPKSQSPHLEENLAQLLGGTKPSPPI